jgi:uncharacterized protein
MSLHAVVVPAFLQTLKALSGVLAKAEAHCEAKKIAPEALLTARLFPDMYPLTRQVQAACDGAAKSCARLAGVDIPVYPDEEKSFAELQKRIEAVSNYLKGFTEQQFEGAATKEVSVPAGSRTLNFTGAQFLASFALPNFYFHATTAYDILRHNGIEIGKRDFLGMS